MFGKKKNKVKITQEELWAITQRVLEEKTTQAKFNGTSEEFTLEEIGNAICEKIGNNWEVVKGNSNSKNG